MKRSDHVEGRVSVRMSVFHLLTAATAALLGCFALAAPAAAYVFLAAEYTATAADEVAHELAEALAPALGQLALDERPAAAV